MRRAAATAVAVLASISAGRAEAAELCEIPPIDAGLVSIDGEPYTTQITSDRGAVVHEDMVQVWVDFVDRLVAANDESWISNSAVRFYTLTGGTIRIEDSDGFVFHVFQGAGVVKMPEDGTGVGTVVAPEAVFDFDKPYSLLDGAIVAKRITASATGGGRVTGAVGSATLVCADPITPVGNIVPEAGSPSAALATTGGNLGPGYVLAAVSGMLGTTFVWVSRRAALETPGRPLRGFPLASRGLSGMLGPGRPEKPRRDAIFE